MGWFDEQIKNREENDSEVLSDAFAQIAGAVLGKKIVSAINSNTIITKYEIERILKFYRCKVSDIPEGINDINEQLDFLLQPHGIMRRSIKLTKGWYKDAIGALLGVRKEDGKVVALLPRGLSGYVFYDENGERRKLNKKTENLFEDEAICFYKPFPLKKLGINDLLKYIADTLSMSDYAMLGIAALALTIVGMFAPRLNQIIFSDIIESGEMRLVLAMSVFLVCVSVSSAIISSIKSLIIARINTKLSITVEAAAMMRVLSLPPVFFKQYSSGNLTSRIGYIKKFCDILISIVLSTGLTSLLSLIYISQIFIYARVLVVPALCIILVTVISLFISVYTHVKFIKGYMECKAELDGFSYSLISGVQKLKLSGSENRAFAKWGAVYSKVAESLYDLPMLVKVNMVLATAISLIGNIVIYYMAVANNIRVADYYAFNTAYAMISGSLALLSGIAISAAEIKPIMDMIRPIFAAVPEASESKKAVKSFSGSIELSNVSFRYEENSPYVIENMSLKIRPGQYVAIVGATGCGKTTLMRLLLGFEKPQKGAIYFDGKDISKIDLHSHRSAIGAVLQDGKLFYGDIYSNIVVGAPWLTIDDAWEAAELAGIADDIRNMPMGMHTVISEGSGGISGGQKQRFMIASAIAPKPKILMFDEATSALDNIAQKKISDALSSLKCTRIVIAHRLSTIKQCDRILVLDNGRIAEEGTYDKLIEENGVFAELVRRQRLDEE